MLTFVWDSVQEFGMGSLSLSLPRYSLSTSHSNECTAAVYPQNTHVRSVREFAIPHRLENDIVTQSVEWYFVIDGIFHARLLCTQCIRRFGFLHICHLMMGDSLCLTEYMLPAAVPLTQHTQRNEWRLLCDTEFLSFIFDVAPDAPCCLPFSIDSNPQY